MYVLFLKDTSVTYTGFSAKKGDIEYIRNSEHTNAFFLIKDGKSLMSFGNDASDSYILCSDYKMLKYIRDTDQYELMLKYIESDVVHPVESEIEVGSIPQLD